MARAHNTSIATTLRGIFVLAGFTVLSITGVGCAAGGVGEPCVPEAVPGNGFTASEVYVETSAVQCRTRVCIVYNMGRCSVAGTAEVGCDPENLESEGCPGGPATCSEDRTPLMPGVPIASDDINRVFCSCRCRAGEGNPNLPICTCGDGYHCADEGYCVPHEADDRYCSEQYVGACEGRCNLMTSRCP